MRDPASYRCARRNRARAVMKALGPEQRNWRKVWAAVQTGFTIRSGRRATPKPTEAAK